MSTVLNNMGPLLSLISDQDLMSSAKKNIHRVKLLDLELITLFTTAKLMRASKVEVSVTKVMEKPYNP